MHSIDVVRLNKDQQEITDTHTHIERERERDLSKNNNISAIPSMILAHVHLNVNSFTYFPIKLIHLRACVCARLHMILNVDYDEIESHDLTEIH